MNSQTTTTMKNIGISESCSENWKGMTPTEKGAFCHRCSLEVYDFTNKSSRDIKQVLLSKLGGRICGRLTVDQENELNEEFEVWQLSNPQSMQLAMMLSLIIVFGLSLFSCTSENDIQAIEKIQHAARAYNLQVDSRNDIGATEYEIIPEVPVALMETVKEIEEEQYIEFQEVVVDKEIYSEDIRYHTMGVMVSSRIYDNYLVETIESSDEIVELDENGVPFPNAFESKVFPNPMTERGVLELKVPSDEIMVVGLYDLSGRHLRNLHEGTIKRGTYTYSLEMINELPGTYLVAIRSKSYSTVTRFIKL